MRLRPAHAVGVGAAVLGLAVAAPALAGVGLSSDPSGQPPPGARVERASDFRPGSQPPAGAKVRKATDFRLGSQPVNRDPQPPSAVQKMRDTDRGRKGARPTKDRGRKNARVTRDLGDR